MECINKTFTGLSYKDITFLLDFFEGKLNNKISGDKIFLDLIKYPKKLFGDTYKSNISLEEADNIVISSCWKPRSYIIEDSEGNHFYSITSIKEKDNVSYTLKKCYYNDNIVFNDTEYSILTTILTYQDKIIYINDFLVHYLSKLPVPDKDTLTDIYVGLNSEDYTIQEISSRYFFSYNCLLDSESFLNFIRNKQRLFRQGMRVYTKFFYDNFVKGKYYDCNINFPSTYRIQDLLRVVPCINRQELIEMYVNIVNELKREARIKY